MKRTCFIVQMGQQDDEGFIPSVVTEGEAGHSPLTGNGDFSAPWHWGKTWKEARATCDRENARLGLTPEDVIAITLSSMR